LRHNCRDLAFGSAAGFLPSDDGCGAEQECCAEKRLLVGSRVRSEEASGQKANNQSTP